MGVRASLRRVVLLAVSLGIALAGIAACTTDSRGIPGARPRPGGYFHLLSPGASLPTDAACAARVRRSPWEPRPDNTGANQTVPRQPVSLARFSQYSDKWNRRYRSRISGNFKGTTDEIIQWAACKWGWSDDLVRAQAVRESHWRMSNEGDFEPRSDGHCPFDDTRDPCPTSFGMMQVKWYFHPTVSNPRVGSSYPLIRESTAFNLDLQLAELRGCYDGMSTYLGNTRGDLWGCIGYWFTGAWRTPAGNTYASGVRDELNEKPWRSW